jgi:hypothetical protein
MHNEVSQGVDGKNLCEDVFEILNTWCFHVSVFGDSPNEIDRIPRPSTRKKCLGHGPRYSGIVLQKFEENYLNVRPSKREFTELDKKRLVFDFG